MRGCIIFFNMLLLIAKDIMSKRIYCQPSDKCWPRTEHLDALKNNLSIVNDCLPWAQTLLWNGLPLPLVDNSITHFNGGLPDDGKYTSFEYVSFRNHLVNWNPAIVVVARHKNDVVQAVKFALNYNLGISIMGTGHSMDDRNAGPVNHSILIQTTCLRNYSVNIHDTNPYNWADGIIKLGAGFTWGNNSWSKGNANYNTTIGAYELAYKFKREMVGGTCSTVGIVGWSLGGGLGVLSPMYGLGVDQILEVEMVGADGSIIVANQNGTIMNNSDFPKTITTTNNDLYWAVKGGGGGTFGIVTSMTLKLHKPHFYFSWITYTWTRPYSDDKGGRMIKPIMKRYWNWVANTATKYWSMNMDLAYNNISKNYTFTLSGTYAHLTNSSFWNSSTQTADYHSLYNDVINIDDSFSSVSWLVKSDNVTGALYYGSENKDWSKEIKPMLKLGNSLRFLVNRETITNENFTEDYMKYWIPYCENCEERNLKNNTTEVCACASGFKTWYALPPDNTTNTYAPISNCFRNSIVQFNDNVVESLVISLTRNLTYTEISDFTKNVYAPAMTPKWSNCTYFNLPEYTTPNKTWGKRYWGEDYYTKLKEIKKTWDPTHTFMCRQCVGYGEEPGKVDNNTMPPWRRSSISVHTTSASMVSRSTSTIRGFQSSTSSGIKSSYVIQFSPFIVISISQFVQTL